MNRLGRKLWTCKWTGAIGCLVIIIVWAFSVTRSVQVEKAQKNGALVVRLGEGSLRIFSLNAPAPNQWWFDFETVHPVEWSFGFTRPKLTRDDFELPMWLPFVLAVPLTVILWFCDRLRTVHGCPPCGSEATDKTSREDPVHEAHAGSDSASLQPRRLCHGCRYVLDGLPDNRCPECGRQFDPQNPATFRTDEPGKSDPAVRWMAIVIIAVAAAFVIMFHQLIMQSGH